jgi:Xaa-Pro aminopeptidase
MLSKNDMLLLDSGGQYLDGTTDATRTMHFGKPTKRQAEMFTRVLKGHIALDRTVFPAQTPGVLLDAFARQHLWQVGCNYNHGTGHGVGAALNVHEGPHRISPLIDLTQPQQGLLSGMIVSNEPGYYEMNQFGIRIENLLLVQEKKELVPFGGKQWLSFEKLTMIPIQKKMIVKELLTKEEIEWINFYHEEVANKIFPLLRTELAKKWLRKETLPI